MKRPLQHFEIPYKGLQDGQHQLYFEVQDSFFSHFEHSIIDNGRFNVQLDLHKKPDHSELIFTLEGTTIQTCDRCLGDVEVPIAGTYTMYLKRGKDQSTDEDIIHIGETASSFNVAQPIYEIITVLLPLRKVHPEVDGKSCIDKELDDLDAAAEPDDGASDIWASLQDLKFDK